MICAVFAPASPAAVEGPGGRVSARLSQPLVIGAIEQASPAQRACRLDGWTPERIRTFLTALSQCGVVADAARAAGLSKQSAYALRNSARGRAFDVAWRAALLLARRRLADEVMSRALNGCVELIVRDGEVWGERHRFDNRLTMAVLTRLDQLAESITPMDKGPSRIAHEFEAFVETVCAGASEAAEFVHSRCEMPYHDFYKADIIDRNLAWLEGDAAEDGEEAEAPADEPAGADDWSPSTSSTSQADDVAAEDDAGPDEWRPSTSSTSQADEAGAPVVAEPVVPAIDPEVSRPIAVAAAGPPVQPSAPAPPQSQPWLHYRNAPGPGSWQG